jgi:hypothetical protein
MSVLLDIPPDLGGRGIGPPSHARGLRISLDVAEPWGGGSFVGRVEAAGEHDARPVTVGLRCVGAWLDIAPQLVGQGSSLSPAAFYDLRSRRRGIWLDEPIWSTTVEVGSLEDANWRGFRIAVPDDLPRAIEGTFCAVRYAIEARRRRTIGHVSAVLPVLVVEPRTLPVIRIEHSPTGDWRLIEWRSEGEVGVAAGSIAISYDERRPEDAPRPGETPEDELLRRVYGRTGRIQKRPPGDDAGG